MSLALFRQIVTKGREPVGSRRMIFLTGVAILSLGVMADGGGSPITARQTRAVAKLGGNALVPLPIGSVRPEGWLKHELTAMTEGLVGRLYEQSEHLKPDNGWWDPKGHGWEEQPYWLRSFVRLAILTQNERCLKVAREWIENVLSTRDADGWFGPRELKEHPIAGSDRKLNDIWAHMPMCEALLVWYDYTGDRRIVDLLAAFCRYCLSLDGDMLVHSLRSCGLEWKDVNTWPIPTWHWCIQCGRADDLVPVLFRLHEITGEEQFLALADRLHRAFCGPNPLFLDKHNVSFSQKLAYWSVYSRRSGNPADLLSAEYWYSLHMAEWGQMPRGIFAADENTRLGCTDPRYGTEACAWAELTRSFQLLSDVTGDTVWADRNEDIVFNHAPAAYTPDWRAVHYITAANQVNLDARTDHNYDNLPPMVAYSATDYRCCRHNAALTFPLFTENLVKRSSDGALVFWMYAPSSGKTALDGNEVSWRLETGYPFRETARLTVQTEAPLVLRFRVPRWAKAFRVGEVVAAKGARTAEVRVPLGKSALEIVMGTACEFRFWPRNGGVTVDRGPLSYSLAIGERYVSVRGSRTPGGSQGWVESKEPGDGVSTMIEVLPTTPWNYGLDVSRSLAYAERPLKDDVFTADGAPCEIMAEGRRIPEWGLQDGQPAELQRTVVYSAEPPERLRFVPLGCQRLRLSVLPQVTADPEKGARCVRWQRQRESTGRKDRPQQCPH